MQQPLRNAQRDKITIKNPLPADVEFRLMHIRHGLEAMTYLCGSDIDGNKKEDWLRGLAEVIKIGVEQIPLSILGEEP